jgi:hypothetical protein
MKYCIILLFLFPIILQSQTKTLGDLGFRHLQIDYKGDKVDILHIPLKLSHYSAETEPPAVRVF